MIVWNFKENDRTDKYAWIKKGKEIPQFGQIYYNASTDLIFIRTVVHDFGFEGNDRCLVMDKPRDFLNCVYIGEL